MMAPGAVLGISFPTDGERPALCLHPSPCVFDGSVRSLTRSSIVFRCPLRESVGEYPAHARGLGERLGVKVLVSCAFLICLSVRVFCICPCLHRSLAPCLCNPALLCLLQWPERPPTPLEEELQESILMDRMREAPPRRNSGLRAHILRSVPRCISPVQCRSRCRLLFVGYSSLCARAPTQIRTVGAGACRVRMRRRLRDRERGARERAS